MTLTIITGLQGSGKSTYLSDLLAGSKNCSLYLPYMDNSIRIIMFDDVTKESTLHRLAAMCLDSRIRYTNFLSGIGDTKESIEVIAATQLPKKQIQHIFKGIKNVKWLTLCVEEKQPK